MKDEIQLWNYEGSSVRTIQKDGEPWFVLKDVCKVLEISNSRNVANRLEPFEKGVTLVDTLGGAQEMTIINESGLYAVILRSDKPQAKPFRKWVTSEVLPAIRKTGAYVAHPTPKASSIREVVNLIRITRETMEAQGCPASDIAKVVKEICDQFNVKLPDCFVKPETTTMADVYDMIDFVFSWPGKRKPTYDDFIVHRAMLKLEMK